MLQTDSLTLNPGPQLQEVYGYYSPVPGVFFSERGMEIAPDTDLTYDMWAKSGMGLRSLHHRSFMVFMWGWGDWIREGQHRFGEKYSQGIALTGLQYITLANYVYAAEHTPRYLRGIPGLGQRHYLVVAKIKNPAEKLKFLVEASVNRTASGKLKSMVNESLVEDGINPNTLPQPPPATTQDKLDQLEQETFLLEQKNVTSISRIGYLEDVIRQAVIHLQNDQVGEAIASLTTVPHRGLMRHIEEAISQFRNGEYADHAESMNKIVTILEEYENGN